MGWMTAEKDPWIIPEYLCVIAHTPILPPRMEHLLTRLDRRLFDAGLVGRVK
jgi:hypothetical protein